MNLLVVAVSGVAAAWQEKRAAQCPGPDRPMKEMLRAPCTLKGWIVLMNGEWF